MASSSIPTLQYPDDTDLNDPKGRPQQAQVVDGPFITVQIPESEIFGDETDSTITQPKKKTNWFKRQVNSSQNIGGVKTVPVRMRKEEFTKYFIKNPKTGQYHDGVVEPPGGRKQWLQERIEDFKSGMLDVMAYTESGEKEYEDLGRKKSSVEKAINGYLDWTGTPDLPWAGKPIR